MAQNGQLQPPVAQLETQIAGVFLKNSVCCVADRIKEEHVDEALFYLRVTGGNLCGRITGRIF